jgi:hypothetical protein
MNSEAEVYTITMAATIASMCHDFLGHGITSETFVRNLELAAKNLRKETDRRNTKGATDE